MRKYNMKVIFTLKRGFIEEVKFPEHLKENILPVLDMENNNVEILLLLNMIKKNSDSRIILKIYRKYYEYKEDLKNIEVAYVS